MGKWVKRVLAVVLVCALVGGVMPLGATTVVAASDADFDLYKFRADALTKPHGEGGWSPSQSLLEYYLTEYQTGSRIWVDILKDDAQFMGGLAAWDIYTISISDAVSDLMEEQQLYETILFAILQVYFESSDFTQSIIKSTAKDYFSLAEQVADIFGTVEFYDLDLSDPRILGIANELVDQSWHGTASTVMGAAFDILQYSSDVNDYLHRMASFMSLARLGDDLKAVLADMREHATNAHLRAALDNTLLASDDVIGQFIVSVREAALAVSSVFFREMTSNLITNLALKASPVAAAIVIGRDAGRAIGNLLCSTDNVSNQFRALQAMVDVENLMRRSTTGLRNSYSANSTTMTAQTFLSSVELLFSTYSISIDYAIDFVKVAFGKGLVTKWMGGDAILAEFTESYSNSKKSLSEAQRRVTFGWEILLQQVYPDWFVAITEFDPDVIPLQAIAPLQENITLRVGETVIIGYDLVPANTTDSVFVSSRSENNDILKGDWSVDALMGYRAVAVGTTRVRIFTDEYLHGVNPNIEAFVNITVVPNEGTPTNPITDYTYTLSDNKATITGYTGSNDVLNIPSFIGQYPVVAIGDYAFRNKTFIRRAVIPYGVITIGYSAFQGCTSLTNLILSNSVSIISSNSFQGCTALVSVVIPNGVTSIGRESFQGCTSLSNLTIGTSVTSIAQSAFQDCTSLTSVVIPDNVTSVGQDAFRDCASLKNLSIGGGVTSLSGFAILNCPIENLSINMKVVPETFNYSYGGAKFHLRETLKSISFGSNVTTISSSAFTEFSLLTTVNWSNSVTSIGSRAFWKCTALDGIIIPNSVISIGSWAFYDTALTSLNIPRSVTEIGGAAFGRTNLISLTIPGTVKTIGSQAFYANPSLTDVIIQHGVTEIPDRAFEYCTSLKNVTIPHSVTTIGWNAFSGCTSLESIEIPDSVTEIGYGVFYNCRSLKDITLPDSITLIGSGVFYWCSLLTSINIPYGITEIGDNMFEQCHLLTQVNIPETVRSIGNSAFSNCDSLVNITIPNSVTSIGRQAFWSCDSLIRMTLPNSVTAIGSEAFIFCRRLESITIPRSVSEIGNGAFTECYSLTIHCYKDSKAHTYAVEKGIPFVLLDGEGDISKVALNARIAEVENTQKGNYTDVSWAAFQSALSNAQAVASNASATQAQLNSAFAALNAAYAGLREDTSSTTYIVTVNNGTGGGNFAESTTVTITANTAPIGQRFKQWNISPIVTFTGGTSSTSPTAQFTMPLQAVTATAVYENLPANQYAINVQTDGNGTASASATSATQGTEITLTASANSGYRFKQWQVSSGGVTITNNKFTMPAGAVTVKAIFETTGGGGDGGDTKYALIVVGGSGSGDYAAEAIVPISANVPSGKVFDKWSATIGTIANPTSASTTFTMPAGAATVTANFKDAPKGIFSTNPKWYGEWWHYLLFFLCFGFIWMWF